MSTSKKPMRRGRQKQSILDDEDLKRQEQMQDKEREKGEIGNGDMFDTAKLDKNYFVRHEEKVGQHESEIFNFDDQQGDAYKSQSIETKPQQPQPQTKPYEQSTQKKGKRRDMRKRPKKQNIFNSDQQEQQPQHSHPIKQHPITQTKPQPQISQSPKKPTSKQQEQLYELPKLKTPQKLSEGKTQQQQKISSPEQQQEDEFDKQIKKQEEESQDDEKVYILHKEVVKFTKENRKEFYFTPLPPNHVSYAYFKRFSSGLSQVYQLCGQDHRPLLFCQNQRGCIGANYYLSITKEMDKNNPNYLGKLRGNAAGSTYFLYDDGLQPKNQLNRSEWRVSMAAIQYENNFMGMNGPRKLKVTTPSAKLLEDADTFKLSQEESLLNFIPPIISQYRNKTPKWNERLKSYALNFGGRVKLASIKNFILISNTFDVQDEDQADNVIVFGKIDENTFSLEFRHPLSLFQAFGIVMSEFDFKINCE